MSPANIPKRAIFLLPLYAEPVSLGNKTMELRSWPNPFAHEEDFGIMESGHSRIIGKARVGHVNILDLTKEEDRETLWRWRDQHLVAELNNLQSREELVEFVVQMMFETCATRNLYVWHLCCAVRCSTPLPIKPWAGARKIVGSIKHGWLESVVLWDAVRNSTGSNA